MKLFYVVLCELGLVNFFDSKRALAATADVCGNLPVC